MDYISRRYGKVRLIEKWTDNDGVEWGQFKAYTYGITVNLRMGSVEPF